MITGNADDTKQTSTTQEIATTLTEKAGNSTESELIEVITDDKQQEAAAGDISGESKVTTVISEEKLTKSEAPIKPATLAAHFIDVGQGASVIFILKDNNSNDMKTMLIDAGDNDDEKRIVEYLKDVGVSKLDVVIGTHGHSDHIGGLDAVIDAFEIGSIYMPKASSNTATFEDVLTTIANKNLKVNTAKAGVSIALDPRLDIQLVGPVKNYDDLNDMSAVVRIQFGESSFLVTADIEKTSESDIVASGANLQADVMQIPHHASDTSSTEAFLNAVNPTYGVIQVGAENNYGHPTVDVLERLNKHNIKIYRNDLQGYLSTLKINTALILNNSPVFGQVN